MGNIVTLIEIRGSETLSRQPGRLNLSTTTALLPRPSMLLLCASKRWRGLGWRHRLETPAGDTWMTMIRRHRLTVRLALLRLTVRPALLPPLGRATMPWKRELRLQLRLRFRLRLMTMMTMMSMIWRHSWID
jgi:hypothetical protein